MPKTNYVKTVLRYSEKVGQFLIIIIRDWMKTSSAHYYNKSCCSLWPVGFGQALSTVRH